MSRKILLICALACTVFAFGCNEQKQAEAPAKPALLVAVIDAQTVFEKSKVSSAGIAYVDEIAASFKTVSDEMLAKLEANPELEPQIQAEYTRIQQEIEAAQRKVAENVYKSFEDTVNNYRVENNIAVVVQKQLVVSSADDADISEKIAAKIDSMNLDFKEGVAPVNFKLNIAETPKADAAASEK